MKRGLGPTVERVAVALRDLACCHRRNQQEGTQMGGKTLGNGVGGHLHICLLLPGDGLSTVLCSHLLFEIECCGKKKDTGIR